MTTSLRKLLQEKREEILKIATKHGAYNLRIFGSVARGEERQDSDVDFLVDMESDRNLLDRIGEDILGRKVDVATVKVLRYFCREGILKDAVPL